MKHANIREFWPLLSAVHQFCFFWGRWVEWSGVGWLGWVGGDDGEVELLPGRDARLRPPPPSRRGLKHATDSEKRNGPGLISPSATQDKRVHQILH